MFSDPELRISPTRTSSTKPETSSVSPGNTSGYCREPFINRTRVLSQQSMFSALIPIEYIKACYIPDDADNEYFWQSSKLAPCSSTCTVGKTFQFLKKSLMFSFHILLMSFL